MTEFAIARQNMVDCQIVPSRVHSPVILNSFLSIPREKFIPRQMARVAYMDDEIVLGQDAHMLRPETLARLFEAADLHLEDKVLYLSCLSGYGPAVLSSCVHSVVGVELNNRLSAKAERIIQELNIKNVEIINGSPQKGWAEQAPYDLIFIEGVVEEMPHILFDQLKEVGRIVTIKAYDNGTEEAIRVEKRGEKHTAIPLFNAYGAKLDIFAKKTGFNF